MLLKYVTINALIEIIDIEQLMNPFAAEVVGKSQAGEEEQEDEKFPKKKLLFPSGEQLPRCWLDKNYQHK